MKHFLQIGLSTLALLLWAGGAAAQEWYDLTEVYLRNANFSENIDYTTEDNLDVRNKLNDIAGWKLDEASAKSNTVGATFQYGTPSTFFKVPIPATGPDGQSEGACLTLCASLKHELTFYQQMKLPAGDYLLTSTSMNCNPDSEDGASRTGWWVSKDVNVICQRTNFPLGQWVTDSVFFHVDELTTCHIQLGFQSAGGRPTNSAMLVVDNVRLKRTTPYDQRDEEALLPTVVSDSRYVRGATMAFARIKSIDGENIEEKGFCWATHKDPTYDEAHTTKVLKNNGDIYWLRDLQPATLYYMRAYAKTANGQIGYGQNMKFYTIPKGQITYTFRPDGDEATQKRIKEAAETAIGWWNELTEMKDFHPSIGFVNGVPTADCSYGGWIRVGSNASYQRCGTIMHEMLHGCGVIPWADTEWSRHNLRESQNGDGYGTGHWLGDRVSEVLNFWDNTTNSRLNGDYQHMWPYGINGAHEDNGSDVLYIGCSLVCQALGEDGLQHTNTQFAEPYYAFDQEDDVKYYLKNEDANRGLRSAFLMPNASGKLRWVTLEAGQAQENDSAAWYITFTPENQYYQLRNAATGQYLTYAGGFKTMERATPGASDDFHLMKGRVNVGSSSDPKRGYWLIHPTNNWTPPCLAANANGATVASTFNIANSAKSQRWLILTAEELAQFEQPNAISSPTSVIEPAQPHRIYSLDGRRLSQQKEQLKPGIYIIDGKKTIIR